MSLASTRLRRPWTAGLLRYGFSLLAVGTATALTHSIEPLHQHPTDLYFAAIVLVAWLCGKWPAVLASVLSTFAVDYFIIPPLFSVLTDVADFVRFAIFLFVALLICYLQDRFQRTAHSLQEMNDVLEQRVQERTTELATANRGLKLEITDRESAERALTKSEASLRVALDRVEKSLQEKEVLFRELDHRVKNNLQIISSLLSLQSHQLQEAGAREIFKDCQNRVRAIALAHQRLCAATDISSIDLNAYFRQLVQELFVSYCGGPGKITSHVTVDSIDLSVDQLVPCALIVNELVSNALKHAFPSNSSGDVRVEIHGHKNFVDITVADDGIGFSPGKTDRQSGVGLQIVQALARQLSGNICWANGRGTSATVTFPAPQ